MDYFDFRTLYFAVIAGVSFGFLTYFEFWHDKIEFRYPRGSQRKRMMFFTMLALMIISSFVMLGIIVLAKYLADYFS